MKRFWSVLLCLSFVLSLCPLSVGASEVFYEAGFDYEKISSGTEAQIVNYYGLGGNLVIPETLGSLPVTSIADGAISCQSDTQITSLSLPSTLKSFSANAISGNYSLETITLAEGNTSLAVVDGVLYQANLAKLLLYPAASERTMFEVPDSVRIIGSASFYRASNLERIILPENLKTISAAQTNLPGAFEGCTSLRSLSVPSSVSTIGDYAFMDCTSLSEVEIVYSAASLSIGLGAFLNCPALLSVRLYPNVKTVGLEAFGYLSALNEEEIMTTKPVEGFVIYAVDGTAAADYAASCGFSFVKMSIISDFFSSNFSILGSAAALSSVSSISGETVTAGESVTLCERYFASALSTSVQKAAFTPKTDLEIPAVFSDSILYSLPVPSEISLAEPVYVFYVDEAAGALEYVPSKACNSIGAWGDEEERVLFETSYIGSFVVVNAQPRPGFVSSAEASELSVSDLTLMAKHLSGWNNALELLNADVDGDGACRIADLTDLAKRLAGWDVTFASFGENL